MSLLGWIQFVASWFWIGWLWGDMFCHLIRKRWHVERLDWVAQIAHTICVELHPFRWIIFAGVYLPRFWSPIWDTSWWDYLFAGLGILLCVIVKHHDDDDRWKRRKKKAAEVIKRVGSRLVVSPARSAA